MDSEEGRFPEFSGRRRFIKGVVAGSFIAASGARLLAATPRRPAHQPILRGANFELSIAEQEINFTGRPRTATAVNGSVPGPTLYWREGDLVTIRVRNSLPETSSIHWHGILLPMQMDGVPDISFPGIAPGDSYAYRFRVRQSGTYWYHSHSGFQEQAGLYGAIVIEPREKPPFHHDRDYVVMLSDWSDENPARIYAKLKKESDYYNFNQRTVGDLYAEIREKGVARTWRERKMWNRMRMSDRDLSDVTGYTYTYLMNGQTPEDNWRATFRRGEVVRLRFINGSAMTFFDVRIPGLKLRVVAADGQNIEPVEVDEFRIGVAETYDVLVTPADDRPYAIFAQSIERSGYAAGSLTPDAGLIASPPVMDSPQALTHADMGMAMNMQGGMGMNMDMDHEMPAGKGMDHGSMDHGSMDMSKPMAQGVEESASVTHPATENGPQSTMQASNPQYRLDDPGVGLRGNGRRVLTYADIRNLDPTPDSRDPERELELHLTGNMSRYMWSIDGVRYADAEPLRMRHGERLRITLVNDTMMAHPIHLHGMWSDLESGEEARLPRKHTIVSQPGSKISYRVTADAMGQWAYHCHLLYHMMGMFRKVVVS